MTKRFFFAPVFLVVMACSGAENESAEQTQPLEQTQPEDQPTDSILGFWNMDSSVFINQGVRGEVSAPIMPTTWRFDADGSYLVENSLQMPGTFTKTDDSLYVVLMGVPNAYEILVMNETNLHLRSTITEIDSVSIKTDAYLTRIKK